MRETTMFAKPLVLNPLGTKLRQQHVPHQIREELEASCSHLVHGSTRFVPSRVATGSVHALPFFLKMRRSDELRQDECTPRCNAYSTRPLFQFGARAAAHGWERCIREEKRRQLWLAAERNVTAVASMRRGVRGACLFVDVSIRNACRLPCFGVSGRSIAPTVAYTISDSINVTFQRLGWILEDAVVLVRSVGTQSTEKCGSLPKQRNRKGARFIGPANTANTIYSGRADPITGSSSSQAAMRGVRRVLARRVGHAAASTG